MDFENWVGQNGFDAATLSEAQRKPLLAAWKAAEAPDPPAPPEKTLEDIIAAGRAEDERKRKITEIVAAAIQESGADRGVIETMEALGRQGIEGKWDLQKFELEVLRARRPRGGPHIHVRHEADAGDEVVEAAVCRAAGLPDPARHFPAPVLEACDRRYPHGMSLCHLVLTYARRGGFSGLDVKHNPEGAMRAARRASDVQAVGSWGPSTGGASIGAMLANVANKFLRVGFEGVESAWRSIAAIRSANDFKQITTYSLTGDLTFKLVPPGGEIQHGQVDATSYTNQVDTYARMLGIDRRDLVNDDIGAFTCVSRRLGRGAALALNRLFWGKFLNNSSFFTAGRNNVSTGAGSALAQAGLDAANQKFLLQTDPDGNILGVMPKILLVPPALLATARQLMNSELIVSGSTTAAGNANVWRGAFTLVSSAYMQDATLTGNSNAAWYLLADPNDVPVIEVAFLNGQETPTVESTDSDFGMLGQAFRGYYDCGVSLQEYRAGVRSAGS